MTLSPKKPATSAFRLKAKYAIGKISQTRFHGPIGMARGHAVILEIRTQQSAKKVMKLYAATILTIKIPPQNRNPYILPGIKIS